MAGILSCLATGSGVAGCPDRQTQSSDYHSLGRHLSWGASHLETWDWRRTNDSRRILDNFVEFYEPPKKSAMIDFPAAGPVISRTKSSIPAAAAIMNVRKRQ